MSKKSKTLFSEKANDDERILYFYGITGKGKPEDIEEIVRYAAEHGRLIYKRLDLTYLKIIQATLEERGEGK